MYLLAIDSLVLEDLAITAETDTLLTDESQFREFGARSQEGISRTVFVGGTAEPAIWSFVLKCPDVDTLDTVIAALTGDVTTERRLLAQRIDADGTRVYALASVHGIRQIGETDAVVEFEGRDSIWRAETPTTIAKTFSSSTDQVLTLDVEGNTSTHPVLVLTPIAQRSSQTAAVGYRWRRRFTIANNSDVPWYRLPIRVDLGSTTAHVSGGKAQADGDDVRLVLDGIEQERSLVTWNTGASYLWCIIPNLQPGESITFDILSGNSAAVSPPNLAYPNLPPHTLASSSNALWVWPMTTDELGAWHLDRGGLWPLADFAVPGAWRLARTFWNPDHRDNVNSGSSLQQSAILTTAKFFVMRAGEGFPTGQFDNHLDGVEFYHPLGVTSITANFQWANPDGTCSLIILVRNSAAELWARLYANTSATAVPTAVAPGAQTPDTPMRHVAMTVWPTNAYEITPDVTTAPVQAWWDTTLQVAIDTTDLDIDIDADWTEVYELAVAARLGGGGNAEPPYRALLIGNADSDDGAGTPRATVTLAQQAIVDCETHTSEVWSAQWTPAYLASKNAGWFEADAIEGLDDGDAVSQWDDESGNTNHAIQVAEADRSTYQTGQINGLPALDFDGTDAFALPGISASSRDETILAVINLDNASDYRTIVGTTTVGGRQLAVDQTTRKLDYIKPGTAILAQSTTLIALDTPTIAGVSTTGSAVNFDINGTIETVADSTALTASLTSTIGGATGIQKWDGLIAELLIFQPALTSTEREKVEGYLAHKYGLTANLPSAHPYKSASPGDAAFVEILPAHALVAVDAWSED